MRPARPLTRRLRGTTAAAALRRPALCRCPCRTAATGAAAAHTDTDVAIVGGGPVGLTLALLLSKLGVRSTVLERLPAPSPHPQAHFINVRSMEVFRSLVDADGRSVADAIASTARPREEWSCFLYSAGPLLGGTELGSTHHFPPETLAAICQQSPELPTHLPQHQLVPLLLEALANKPDGSATCDVRWATPCAGITQNAEGGGVTLALGGAGQPSLSARRVVCCDGANSPSRAALGLPLTALHPMEQQMVNVHFTSAALAQALRETDSLAMLYFIYAPEVIGVVVAHNLGTGEFALQLPSFGPPLSPEQLTARYTPSHTAELVRLATVGRSGGAAAMLDVEVLSVAGWTMRAAVAQRWVAGDAILCGDAAHVFPPAGGFGMNTGIQDAHALAWRLAVVGGSDESNGSNGSELLAEYEQERRQVAEANSGLSIRNYNGVAELSAAVGCDPKNAELAATLASSVLPSSIFGSGPARGLVEGVVGLAAKGLLSEGALRSSLALGPARVAAASAKIRSGKTLRLHFPAEDLGFCYGIPQPAATAARAAGSGAGAGSPGGEYEPTTAEGARLPFFPVLEMDGSGSEAAALEVTEAEGMAAVAQLLREQSNGRMTSLDVIGDAVAPQMTMFIPVSGDADVTERWRAAAVKSAAGCSVAVVGVDPQVRTQAIYITT